MFWIYLLLLWTFGPECRDIAVTGECYDYRATARELVKDPSVLGYETAGELIEAARTECQSKEGCAR